ncbi:MAG TPA: HNH endonuclease [Terracidiphilus sp.]|nr:HNH endonuclease [Terracidiphilus sp.]
MRPLSFTKNLGGFRKAYDAIRKGYARGITVAEFRARCGLSSGLSLLVTEFFLGTQIRNGDEIILNDTLISQTLSQPYTRLTARLYFFALNLNMPGERLRDEHRTPAEMQNALMRDHLYVGNGLRASRFDKDASIEPTVRSFGGFTSTEALRKWVNNFHYMAEQCGFAEAPHDHIETFPDTWGALALRLFFERYSATNPAPDVNALVAAAGTKELQKLIGAPKSWLDDRVGGAADMFLSEEEVMFLGFHESAAERRAAQRGAPPPPLGGETKRRETLFNQIIRRSKNQQFLWRVYEGECQLSGLKLKMPDGSFSVDCAHIRPLGRPHCGEDDVANMLSLSPTMHRLFDRGCVRIDPDSLAITMLYGNRLPHLRHLLIRENHVIHKGNLSYHLSQIIK